MKILIVDEPKSISGCIFHKGFERCKIYDGVCFAQGGDYNGTTFHFEECPFCKCIKL